MSIVYKCRHCNYVIGELKQSVIETSQLGWDKLSSEERDEMIEYKTNGSIQMNIICDNCQDALDNNPTYHELENFIQ
ncbi:anti-sigma-F factor Fin family protein [Virgibacillus soli]|uniref:Anti-sigma-F factor Fin family protein n=1 Tax=Paracerasibacillus soli TaxID=480284 RepID=A0ABU5CX37_9BACI|nr:anti-sigma-F factor Fin family protein [Virgibacillus soli]MDY0410005.1 anti-sigma-F factor Fin family protein [Virgibacillus soli]